ncbi:hypothetical protein LTR28_012525, partial [Elasticomyces elasticus]
LPVVHSQIRPGRSGLRPCRLEEDRPALHLSTRVRPAPPSRRPHVQACQPGVQDRSWCVDRARQDQEPIPQRRRPLWRPPPILWPYRAKFLHCPLWRVPRNRRPASDHHRPCRRRTDREAQVFQHGCVGQARWSDVV